MRGRRTDGTGFNYYDTSAQGGVTLLTLFASLAWALWVGVLWPLAVPLTGGHEITARGWNGQRQDFDPLPAWDAGDAAAALLRSATGATSNI